MSHPGDIACGYCSVAQFKYRLDVLHLFFYIFLFLLALIFISITNVVKAETGISKKASTQTVLKNPFEKPVIISAETVKPVRTKKKTTVWQPELRATMLGGVRPAVNIDGKILLVGEKIDGFTLMSIAKREATFERNGVQYTLKIDN